jgi:hypothetical protein
VAAPLKASISGILNEAFGCEETNSIIFVFLLGSLGGSGGVVAVSIASPGERLPGHE